MRAKFGRYKTELESVELTGSDGRAFVTHEARWPMEWCWVSHTFRSPFASGMGLVAECERVGDRWHYTIVSDGGWQRTPKEHA